MGSPPPSWHCCALGKDGKTFVIAVVDLSLPIIFILFLLLVSKKQQINREKVDENLDSG